ncbi:MAG: single-stranded-DNA-specific exonuclease RecJ [Arenicellales bacterium]
MQVKTIQHRAVQCTDDTSLDDLQPLLKRVLNNRQIHTKQDINVSLKALLPPEGLKGIEQATQRIAQAITSGESILIVGDYDADGATSTALAIEGLHSMGAKTVRYEVPNRFTYGYGLTLKLAKKISQGISETLPDLVITVDNGISSIEGVAHLQALGVDVIVTDHHLAGGVLPNAHAIVNPNQPGCSFASKALAGVGVMFYVLLSVNKYFRESAYFDAQNLKPDLLSLLDLVALGTVADLVKLDKNNRILVAQGVARMRAGRTRLGISALMKVANRDLSSLVAQDLGFVLGPRINASGRLDNISSGIECLLAGDAQSAQALAENLNQINVERKNIEQSMQKQAMLAVEQLKIKPDNRAGVVLFDKTWHEGIVGLIASRIKDKVGVPVLVFAPGEDGMLKGSARSIPEVHVRDILANIDAAGPELIARFGGHAMAAGLSIERTHLPAFKEAFEQQVAEVLALKPPGNTIMCDGALTEQEFNLPNAKSLKTLLPWGQACPEPQFEGEFMVQSSRFVGEIHLKLVLKALQNGEGVGQPIDAICFRYIDHADSPEKRTALNLKKIKAVYGLDVNNFRGKETLQLMIRHLEAV